MYTIIKPEARLYLEPVEDLLREEGFEVSSRHSIKDWDNVARGIYAPQIQADPVFAEEFDAYLWLTRNMHGNNAVAFLLEKNGSIGENLRDLKRVKERFREEVLNGDIDSIRLFLNLDRLGGNQQIGLRGKLGVDGQEFQGIDMRGNWDYFFFKYIHTPEPENGDYQREVSVLMDKEVLDYSISEKQWDQMKYLQTLVVPGTGEENDS